MLLPVRGSDGGCDFLLSVLCRRMRDAGADQVVVVASIENRALIEAYVPTGAIVVSATTQTMIESVLVARRFAGDDMVLFGMPDTYWGRDDLYKFATGRRGVVPVTAWCWEAAPEQRSQLGMCRISSGPAPIMTGKFSEIPQGNMDFVREVVDKPAVTDLTWAWGAAAWEPQFWAFLHKNDKSLHEGLNRAIGTRVPVRAVKMPGRYYDCGTLSGYEKMLMEVGHGTVNAG
jgi:UTP-glucose-1-phosphate uridylyltransferase